MLSTPNSLKDKDSDFKSIYFRMNTSEKEIEHNFYENMTFWYGSLRECHILAKIPTKISYFSKFSWVDRVLLKNLQKLHKIYCFSFCFCLKYSGHQTHYAARPNPFRRK